MKETTTQKKRRLEKKRKYNRQKRAEQKENNPPKSFKHVSESKQQRKVSDKKRKSLALLNELQEQRELRLELQRIRTSQAQSILTPEQLDSRRATEKERISTARSIENEDSHYSRLAAQRERSSLARSIEPAEKREERLKRKQQRTLKARSIEDENSRHARLAMDREQTALARSIEAPEQRVERLRHRQERYRQTAKDFTKRINTFAQHTCEICHKICLPHQVTKYRSGSQAKPYLPQVLADKAVLEVCHRCNTHLKNENNTMHPSTAYWNNLEPGDIPDEIKVLTEVEKRMLTRIMPFVKVIKYPGRFGQYGCKGQAVLFAYDIFEVSEKLPQMLPRGTQDCGIVVVTETLENLNISRDYTVSRDRLYAALQWLIHNNPLYKDVTINHVAQIDQADIVRVIPAEQLVQRQQEENAQQRSAYRSLDVRQNSSRILRASWNQGNQTFMNAGTQCFAMVVANIVRAEIIPPTQWRQSHLNQNMLEADALYNDIKEFTLIASRDAHPIPRSGYLELKNLDVIKDEYIMFERGISFQYDDDWICTGILNDSVNDSYHMKLKDGIAYLFAEHNAGVLLSSSKSLGLMHYDGKYYFTDSHSCGLKGAPAQNDNGRACIIECDTMEELIRIVRRSVHSDNVPYLIHYIDVQLLETDVHKEAQVVARENHPEQQLMNCTPNAGEADLGEEQEFVPVQTSVMAPIDVAQPDVEEEVIEGKNLNEIFRKTKDNIVNQRHEKKAEEYAYFSLFPRGIHGLYDDRPVKISVLDYFHTRVMNRDTRFSRNDYLFFALSNFENTRLMTNISVHCKATRMGGAQVEDIHLIMKNLRGSAAYWRSSLSDLIAMIRCLGAPTWFLTLSCNDLHWLDMRKALLIADRRPDVEPSSILKAETQRLIERHPVALACHFQQRVNAFLSFIKKDDSILAGKVKDLWWRIEFQKRGSPHLHMVVWIEDAPSFESEGGIAFIDCVASCCLPTEEEDPDLHALVKRNQIHCHTHTCYKNNETGKCRFNFPRQVCTKTRILSQSSSEFIQSGGRICLLERKAHEKNVNNYCQKILEIWDGNMDIQPCGTDEAIAYYIAKYISKSEPTDLDTGVAQVIQRIRQDPNTNIQQRLRKVCNKLQDNRQVSAAESAYRLCHLPLKGSSRKVTFLNTRNFDLRYKMIKFHGDKATDFCTDMIKRYEKRPLMHEKYDFEEMNLTRFAMLFESHYPRKKKNVDEGSADEEAGEEEAPSGAPQGRQKACFITLTDGRTKMKIRNRPAVIRVPHFVMANDPESYFYSMLMQFKPFRNEGKLLGEFNSAREAFLACEQELLALNRDMELYRSRVEHLENAFRQAHALTIFEQPEDFVEEEIDQEVNNSGMTDDQFQYACATMNALQCELFNDVTKHIQAQMNGSEVRLRRFITGGAGVGKTFIFNLLKNQINRCYGKTVVKVCAPTGVAALLVGGSTIHSLLKLPVEKNGQIKPNMPLLTGNYLKVMRLQWKDIEYIFIDEISMVAYEILCMIDSRLRQLKNKLDKHFGGLNIFVFGDLMQLPPVRGSPIYKQPLRFIPATHLWHLLQLVKMTQNMRQQGDTSFADLLNALREGKLEASHFQLLMSKLLTEETGEFAINKAIRIFPTNKQVDEHNNKVLEMYRVQGERIFEISAQDTVIESTRNMGNVDIDSIIYMDPDKTGGLVKKLQIFVGARVMLRSNINLEKGLVNGSMGVITEIIWPNFRRDQMYDTDIPSVRIDFGKYGIQVIEPKAIQFPAMRNYGTVERRQLPMILCWACTVHKMQGCTVDNAVIYLGPKLFAAGQAYVALSRVRSLDGLRIIELDCSKLTGTTPCNVEALDEMERMQRCQPPNND